MARDPDATELVDFFGDGYFALVAAVVNGGLRRRGSEWLAEGGSWWCDAAGLDRDLLGELWEKMASAERRAQPQGAADHDAPSSLAGTAPMPTGPTHVPLPPAPRRYRGRRLSRAELGMGD